MANTIATEPTTGNTNPYYRPHSLLSGNLPGQNGAPGNAPNPLPNGVTQYGPNGVAYQGEPNQNELVSGQLHGLLESTSPYITQARAQAAAQSASRGLLNSSIAAGAGQNAAIAAALPIAQGNAQQYANTAAANQMASNQQLGAQTAADAQTTAAGLSAGATISAAKMYSDAQLQGQQLQYQIAGQQLGYNYAQLGQQNNQFTAQLAQNNQQFGATLNNQQNEFQQSQSLAIGQFQAGQSWNQYALGVQLQSQSQNAYAQQFAEIMGNPNMTPEQRQSALGTAQQFYSGWSQQNAMIPAFTPPWISDPGYWTNNWQHP